MEQILNTQLFGLLTIIIFYNIGLFIQKKARNPICNGLLIAIILIILFLKGTSIPYENFKIGADTINFLLGPVTIVLAVPLYRQLHLFKKYMKEILVKIRMIEYFVKKSIDKKLINFKKYENIGNHLLEINKMVNSWILCEKIK